MLPLPLGKPGYLKWKLPDVPRTKMMALQMIHGLTRNLLQLAQKEVYAFTDVATVVLVN